MRFVLPARALAAGCLLPASPLLREYHTGQDVVCQAHSGAIPTMCATTFRGDLVSPMSNPAICSLFRPKRASRAGTHDPRSGRGRALRRARNFILSGWAEGLVVLHMSGQGGACRMGFSPCGFLFLSDTSQAAAQQLAVVCGAVAGVLSCARAAIGSKIISLISPKWSPSSVEPQELGDDVVLVQGFHEFH
jgi:hypothetical protein